MAQLFKLNGITISRVTRGDWSEDSASSGPDGTLARLRWVRHTWQADVLAAADFNTLYAAEGTRCSIDTPAHDDRNAADYRTYYNVLCQRVTGRHEGPIFVGVLAEFLVRL